MIAFFVWKEFFKKKRKYGEKKVSPCFILLGYRDSSVYENFVIMSFVVLKALFIYEKNEDEEKDEKWSFKWLKSCWDGKENETSYRVSSIHTEEMLPV